MPSRLMPVVVAFALLLLAPAAARSADLSWGAPTAVNATGYLPVQEPYACATATQCTVVDIGRGIVTFDPTVPGSDVRRPAPAAYPDGFDLAQLTCPETSVCIGLGQAYPDGVKVVRFNPLDPSGMTVAALPGDVNRRYLSCPTSIQCTVTAEAGFGDGVRTFDPRQPGDPPYFAVTDRHLYHLDCPSSTRCAATGDASAVFTFNPQNLQTPTTATSLPAVPNGDLSCPTASQCSLIDSDKRVSTFDPGSPAVVTRPATVIPGYEIRCPTAARCAVRTTDGVGVFTFDPLLPAQGTTTSLGSGYHVTTCARGSTRCLSTLQPYNPPSDNRVATFDLAAPAAITPWTINRAGALRALACPAANTCVGAGFQNATAFDPATPAATSTRPLPVTVNALSFACASASLCLQTDGDGNGATFDPRTSAAASTGLVSFQRGTEHADCPTATQCTAITSGGEPFTFDPTHLERGSVRGTLNTLETVLALDCPTVGSCVATDAQGNAYVFDPRNAAATVKTIGVVSGQPLISVTCPTATQCSAVDGKGTLVTFFPGVAGKAAVFVNTAGGVPVDVACASEGDCVAPTSGPVVLEGDPRSPAAWRAQTLGTTPLVSAACASADRCVVSDTTGQVRVGSRPGAAVTPPATTGGGTTPTPAPGPATTPAPPAGTPLPGPATTPVAASDTAIRAALAKALVPTGRAAALKLLRVSGWSFSFKAPATGTLTVRWTVGTGRRAVVVAQVIAKVTAGRTVKLRLKLTAKGRKLLRARKVRVSARATFAVKGRKTLSATKTVTLK